MNRKTCLRPTYLEVDLDSLKYNMENIKKFVGDTKLMGVLKADGYGLGAVEVARLGSEYLDYIGVASLVEALELRKYKIETDILILGYIEENHIDLLVSKDISQTIYNLDQARKIDLEAKRQNKIAKVHIKVDTGMSRLGLQVNTSSADIVEEITRLENLYVEGIFTHFIDAENYDKTLCELQYKRFTKFLDMLHAKEIDIDIKHILNSGGIIDLIDYKMDMVRAGIILYGLYPEEVKLDNIKIEFPAGLRSKIADIKYIEAGDYVGYSRGFQADRKMKIATIPIGYADGYTEEIRSKINPKLAGEEVRVIGNICMDQTILDISGLNHVKIGDIVSLFGEEDKDDMEIRWVSSIARRVPRVYLENDLEKYTRDYLLD